MELAVATGIPFSEWAAEDEAVALTAVDVLELAHEKGKG